MPAARSAGNWSMTASKTGRGVRKAGTPGTSRRASGSGSSRCLRVSGGDGGGDVGVAEDHDRALVKHAVRLAPQLPRVME
eukprot:4114230-Prymnesium_polylepis.1